VKDNNYFFCIEATYFMLGSKANLVPENKELFIIPNASHCDLYDGGKGNYIPFDKLEVFFRENLKSHSLRK